MRNTNTILVFSAMHRYLVDSFTMPRFPGGWYSVHGLKDYPFYVCEWNGTHELSASVWGLSKSVAGAVVSYFQKKPNMYKPDEIFPHRAKPYTVDRAPLLRVRMDIRRKKVYLVTCGCSTFEVKGKKNLGGAIDKFLQSPEHHMRRFQVSNRSMAANQDVPGFEDYGVKYNGRASWENVSEPLPTLTDHALSAPARLSTRREFIEHLHRAKWRNAGGEVASQFIFIRPRS